MNLQVPLQPSCGVQLDSDERLGRHQHGGICIGYIGYLGYIGYMDIWHIGYIKIRQQQRMKVNQKNRLKKSNRVKQW